MERLVNLTPHEIVLVGADNSKITIPPSGIVARVEMEKVIIGEVNGFPISVLRPSRPMFIGQDGSEIELPQEEGVYYIVSRTFAEVSKRPDLLIPDESVRDENGKIIGVRGFAKIL